MNLCMHKHVYGTHSYVFHYSVIVPAVNAKKQKQIQYGAFSFIVVNALGNAAVGKP